LFFLDSLIDFLTNLDIIREGNMIHETFGNVLELIMVVSFLKISNDLNWHNIEIIFKQAIYEF
jgi:hypothetical protein